MKIRSPWPWPQGHPRGVDGAHINFRPISTIMPNMNEIHQRAFKIWGLINFNAKTLTLWQKDERTNERTYVRTNEQMDKRKSENYIPPHTSYVEGIKIVTGHKHINWVDNHPMIITAKYSSHHFTGYGENAVKPFSHCKSMGVFCCHGNLNQEVDWPTFSYFQLPLPIWNLYPN